MRKTLTDGAGRYPDPEKIVIDPAVTDCNPQHRLELSSGN
jgi:hypothetical protein